MASIFEELTVKALEKTKEISKTIYVFLKKQYLVYELEKARETEEERKKLVSEDISSIIRTLYDEDDSFILKNFPFDEVPKYEEQEFIEKGRTIKKFVQVGVSYFPTVSVTNVLYLPRDEVISGEFYQVNHFGKIEDDIRKNLESRWKVYSKGYLTTTIGLDEGVRSLVFVRCDKETMKRIRGFKVQGIIS